MKKRIALTMAFLLAVSMAALTGCGQQAEDPGPPPSDVVNPGGSAQSGNDGTAYDGDVLENAVSVRIGRDGRKDWTVSMYHNAAAVTMLDYSHHS